jgi:serine/threonine protein kinase
MFSCFRSSAAVLPALPPYILTIKTKTKPSGKSVSDTVDENQSVTESKKVNIKDILSVTDINYCDGNSIIINNNSINTLNSSSSIIPCDDYHNIAIGEFDKKKKILSSLSFTDVVDRGHSDDKGSSMDTSFEFPFNENRLSSVLSIILPTEQHSHHIEVYPVSNDYSSISGENESNRLTTTTSVKQQPNNSSTVNPTAAGTGSSTLSEQSHACHAYKETAVAGKGKNDRVKLRSDLTRRRNTASSTEIKVGRSTKKKQVGQVDVEIPIENDKIVVIRIILPPRYLPIRLIQKSLFGAVIRAIDNKTNLEVAVKFSLCSNNSRSLSLPPTFDPKTFNITGASRSHNGVLVLEDVKREVNILRLLMGRHESELNMMSESIPILSLSSVDPSSWGLSHGKQHNTLNALKDISRGYRHFSHLVQAIDTGGIHYLFTEFINGSDLYTNLSHQSHHKVNEDFGRLWMTQLCYAVRYLHSLSVAHLDISLENICIDNDGTLKLIDFGLAAQNPFYSGDRKRFPPSKTNYDDNSNNTITTTTTYSASPHSTPRNCSSHIRLLRENDPINILCFCNACTSTHDSLLANDPAIWDARKTFYPITLCNNEVNEESESEPKGLDRLYFICRPICNKIHKPGKIGYMSWELYNDYCWDAYANDIFACGVVM